MATNDDAPRIAALDGLRGLAIILVMIFHLVLAYPFAEGAHSLYYRLGGVGWIGVDLFFMLSGFLITGILIDSKDQPRYFTTFFARRTLRIFPLYYAVLIGLFVVVPQFGLYDTPELRFVLDRQFFFWTYMTNWGFVAAHGARFFNVDWLAIIHFWSLAVEEQFYVLWPFVVYFLRRRAFVATCLALIAFALAFRVAIAAFGLPQGAAYTLTPARMDTLICGALIAVAIRDPAAWPRLLRAAPWCAAGALVFLAWIFATGDGVWFADPRMHTIGFSVLAIGWGGLLAMCLPGARPRIARTFEARWLRMFGKYSYGLYVLHHLMLPLLSPEPFARTLPESLGATAYVLVCGALFLAVAWASWRLIERPFLRLKRLFRHQTSSAPAAAAI